jgi:hypothetical protein
MILRNDTTNQRTAPHRTAIIKIGVLKYKVETIIDFCLNIFILFFFYNLVFIYNFISFLLLPLY